MHMLQNSNSLSLSATAKTERWNMYVKTISISIIFILILMVGIAVYNAPYLLAYADKPVKSEAIVLFLGNNFPAREKEVNRLLNEGYSTFLIVPSLKKVTATAALPLQLNGASTNGIPSDTRGYPSYYERTHIEVLYAKKIMDSVGLKSAIMVSSPYHMKRIRMICERTFGERARYITYVPTSYEHGTTDLGHTDSADIGPVMLEFVKIFWFYLYASFPWHG